MFLHQVDEDDLHGVEQSVDVAGTSGAGKEGDDEGPRSDVVGKGVNPDPHAV